MDEERTALAAFRGEQLIICQDDRLGLRAVIAIDSTTLGPALGGVRLARYPSIDAAATEARRLAEAMTLKNAAAELPLGGGKAVILDDPALGDRVAVMRRFGEFVRRTGGAYLPGVDMNTTPADLREIGASGAVVSCADADPSPWTARGVHAAMRAAVAHAADGATLAGRVVLVQGAGSVGARLARLCAQDGAEVLVADVRADRATMVADAVDGRTVDPSAVLTTPCDVLAPCATARLLTTAGAGALRCRVVVGAANDVLAGPDTADALRDAGVLVVPDFIANAGGVIRIHADRSGWDDARAEEAVDAIGTRTAAILAEASVTGVPPLRVAVGRARERIATGAAARGPAVPSGEAVAA